MLEILSYILNAILGGGLVVTLATIKSTKSKASSEAKRVEIDNAQKLLDNFDTFIVQPLKTEVNELRKSVYRLQTAIKQIPSCPHADACPVSGKLAELDELRHSEADPQDPNRLQPSANPHPI